jgi:hypothetical protein
MYFRANKNILKVVNAKKNLSEALQLNTWVHTGLMEHVKAGRKRLSTRERHYMTLQMRMGSQSMLSNIQIDSYNIGTAKR